MLGKNDRHPGRARLPRQEAPKADTERLATEHRDGDDSLSLTTEAL